MEQGDQSYRTSERQWPERLNGSPRRVAGSKPPIFNADGRACHHHQSSCSGHGHMASGPHQAGRPIGGPCSEPTAAVGNPPTDAANWNRSAQCPPERKKEISHETQDCESGPEDLPLHAPSLQALSRSWSVLGRPNPRWRPMRHEVGTVALSGDIGICLFRGSAVRAAVFSGGSDFGAGTRRSSARHGVGDVVEHDAKGEA
jgi:hypothetical protein